MDETKRLLENLLVAQILALATQMKMEAKSRGVSSTSDFVSEATRLVAQKRNEVLQGIR